MAASVLATDVVELGLRPNSTINIAWHIVPHECRSLNGENVDAVPRDLKGQLVQRATSIVGNRHLLGMLATSLQDFSAESRRGNRTVVINRCGTRGPYRRYLPVASGNLAVTSCSSA